MKRKLLIGLLAAAAIASGPSQAEVRLLGIGTVDGSIAGANADLSKLPATLENGVAANLLGGLGSGLAYAGGNTYLALPDRGPNATPYNSALDDTASFIARFHTVKLDLRRAAPGAALPFTVLPNLTATSLLWSATALTYGSGAELNVGPGAPAANYARHFYFTGRSDNYDPGQPSTFPGNGRLDPEGIRLSNDGRSVFISDEYGPYLYMFDRETGRRVKAFELPANLTTDVLSPVGKVEIGKGTHGRTANKGMEGLAITPDGKRLVGIMQAALLQDAAEGATKKLVRLVSIDIAGGQAREYGYLLTEGSGVSEIVAINDHEFLVDERDGAGLGDRSRAVVKKLFRIDLAGATEITALTGTEATAAAVKKTPTLDIVQVLSANGIAPEQIPSKIEGLAFGPDVAIDGAKFHTLFVANDNDFLPEAAGPNRVFVFGFTDADLPGYVPQKFGK